MIYQLEHDFFDGVFSPIDGSFTKGEFGEPKAQGVRGWILGFVVEVILLVIFFSDDDKVATSDANE